MISRQNIPAAFDFFTANNQRRRLRPQPSSIKLRGREVLSDCDVNSDYIISPINNNHSIKNLNMDSPLISTSRNDAVISPCKVQSAQQLLNFSFFVQDYDLN